MVLWEPSRRGALLGRFVAYALALATLLLPRSVAQQAREPFSEREVVEALGANVPPRRIATLARQYGISFQVTPETESRLRKAGATDELLEALRRLPPPSPPPVSSLLVRSNPPGAQVFLDGELKGTTDANGEFKLLELRPGAHKIRLTHAGYEDSEQTANLLAGQPYPMTVALKRKEVAPPTAKFRARLVKKCSGELTIGNDKVQFRADCDGDASFEFYLSDIKECGSYYQRSLLAPHGVLEGFYLRPRNGKDRDFRSDSKSAFAILQLLKQYGYPGL